MISFKNRLLDLIEECDSFDTSFGISAVSALQFFDIDDCDKEKVIRTLCMYYGVVDACDKLGTALNMTYDSRNTYFYISAVGTMRDEYIIHEHITIQECDIDDGEIIVNIIIPVNTVERCDSQVHTPYRYEVDRIVLNGHFPTTEGHRVYIV